MKSGTERDVVLLRKILLRCDEALSDINYVGTQDKFLRDSRTQRAMSMSVGQVGELVKVLSDNIKKQNPNVTWVRMQKLRDFLYHEYQNVRWAVFWRECTVVIPAFRDECSRVLTALIAVTKNDEADNRGTAVWGIDKGAHVLFSGNDRKYVIARVCSWRISASCVYWIAEMNGKQGFVRFVPKKDYKGWIPQQGAFDTLTNAKLAVASFLRGLK